MVFGLVGAILIFDPANVEEDKEKSMLEEAGERFMEDYYEKEELPDRVSLSKNPKKITIDFFNFLIFLYFSNF